MFASNHQVRRATVDDLTILRRLWEHARLSSARLEKHLTEFQVAESAVGELLGSIGLQIVEGHGRIHSEVYRAPELAPELQPRFWDRVLVVARNHGLYRLWIQDKSSMFWLEQGFEAAGSDLLKAMPAAVREAGDDAIPWMTFKLRDLNSAAVSVEQEWKVFRQAQQAENDRLLARARFLRLLAAVITVVALMIVAFAIGYLLFKGKRVR